MTEAREWFQVLVPLVNFLAIVIAGYKVVSIAQRGVEGHESRIRDLESQAQAVTALASQLTALAAKFEEVSKEVERMRNRLDRFLDLQSASREG